jgi:nucleotide sugar dehydrogenase
MKKPSIGFIGQGYIGKNYSDDLERRGYHVVRYSLESEHKNNGKEIRNCEIVFIAVPTPTTPKGFDSSILKKVLSLVGEGKTAVIKSTVIPGTTASLQKKFPRIILLHSPEFLSEATAAYEAAHPFSNIIGMPAKDRKHKKSAEAVMKVLPKASFSMICSSNESEIIKYAHNCSGYTQIMFFNVLYDLANKIGADWVVIEKAVKADPLVPNRYSNPVHKSGRGAGGHCFIKDFAAFADIYSKTVSGDKMGIKMLRTMEEKNKELLLRSKKDLNLLAGVYGRKVLKKKNV